MKQEYIRYEVSPEQIKIFSKGEWTLKSTPHIEKMLAELPHRKKVVWDFSGVSDFDSAGIFLFIEYYTQFRKNGQVEVVGYTQDQEDMYTMLKTAKKDTTPPPRSSLLVDIGKYTLEFYKELKDLITFLGHLFSATGHLIFRPKDLRFKEIVYHIEHSGLNALVIIALTAFLVGMVIAYQAAVQLAKFGADIFIVDTVAISITRELGPMITAIVIAGRSGSAYTAEIGAMKITEELSAMRTMGFDPYYFLVLPRVIALMIALPLLIFFADMVGIFGGMVAAKMQLGISMTQFTDRLYEVLEVKHYILGMIKGPVFAFIIAAIGCFRGFQVSDNTESVGLHTTASVVNAIFMVIAFDALFSVIYTELDL